MLLLLNFAATERFVEQKILRSVLSFQQRYFSFLTEETKNHSSKNKEGKIRSPLYSSNGLTYGFLPLSKITTKKTSSRQK